jgi:16S rRNA (guanine966-N2)-methyltransferase
VRQLEVIATARRTTTRSRNRVRIIGGKWRGRLIDIVDDTPVRPTPDRVRETLFNWLAPSIRGATCLDLFAGTGVLGLEALSRGASDVVFIEQDRRLVRALRAQLATLEFEASVIESSALTALRGQREQRFDIAFVDPPYTMALGPVLESLLGWLADTATIYVERPRCEQGLGALADETGCLSVDKEARAGDVVYGLLRFGRA